MTPMIWAIVFVVSTILMVVVVPRRQVADFLLFGLVGGLGVALVMLYFFVPLLGYWRFAPADILTFQGIPLLLAMAWIPIEIIYGWALTRGEGLAPFLAVIGFPLAATLGHYGLILNGNLAYAHWSLSKTFLLALFIHAGLAAYILAQVRPRQAAGSVEPD